MEDFSKRPLGALPSPTNMNNYKLGEFVDVCSEAFLPPGLLVKPYEFEDQIHIYDQASTSTCVAQAASELQAINQWKETGEYVRLSPGWIYGNRNDGEHGGEGMVPAHMLPHLCTEGVPPYSMFPEIGSYQTCKNLFLQRKESLLEKYAKPNKSLSYIELRSVEEVKTALTYLGPVLICIRVFSNFYNVGRTGRVDTPSGDCSGGHMMLIVGYNNNDEYIVANSWGRDWGRNGVCYIPFDYKAITELWAVTDNQKRILKSVTIAQIMSPGAFVIPVRTFCESLDAKVDFKITNGKKTAEAIIPPNLTTRKLTITEGSNEVTVENIEIKEDL